MALQLSGPSGGAAPPLRRLKGSRPAPILTVDCALAKAESSIWDPFASADCRAISERFEVLESLGQGSTAVVYRALPRDSESEVALKVLRIKDEEMLSTAKYEFDLLSSVQHPHIIHALDFFTFSQGVVLVLDYFQGRTLKTAVLEAPAKRLEEHAARRLFAFLMQAVEHLHGSGIIHRDVKAPNVLVNDGLTDLKLVDFNAARRWSDGALTLTGTEDYMPPEVLLGEPHTAAGDVWSSGLCLLFALAGSLPLRRHSFRSKQDFGRAIQKHSATQFHGLQWEQVSDESKEGLRSCLACDPDMRPCASEVARSAWLCE